ncbi:MAG: hypothetical protein GY701_04645 [Sulfitobacter sp.]|nr:hypothetical protein [Sulfitobacter sp.]
MPNTIRYRGWETEMKTKREDISYSQLNAIYDEVELAILYDWMGIARPSALRGVDIESESDGVEQTLGAIHLIHDMFGEYGNNAVSNAVARLVLSEVQGRLPQWAAVHADGRVDLARTYTPKRRAKVDLLPRFLFEINWADSGPGFNWPEAYNVAYLPGFDCYVVTASQDSPEVHGYTDEAIGHFPADEAVLEGVHRMIFNWWKGQAAECQQHRWAYLFNIGDVSEDEAKSWADEIWDPESGEPLVSLA